MLDYFRVLDARARSTVVQRRLQGETSLPLTQQDNAALLFIAASTTAAVSALAAGTGVSVARASRQVARLDELGLIERTAAPEDGRITRLRLTAAGRLAREKWTSGWMRDYARFLDTLGDEAAEFAADIRRLHQDLARQLLTGGSTGEAPNASDSADLGPLDTLIRFAQWAGPALSHPAYARGIIDRIGAPLSPQSLYVLRAVSNYGPVDIGELAERTWIDASSVSRHISTLVDDGLVARAPHPRDARATQVRPTSAGRHVLQVAEAAELGPVAIALSPWSAAEISRCFDHLALLVDGLERAAEDFD